MVDPEVVEPLDDPELQVVPHVPVPHVLLDAVQPRLEVGLTRVHVGDDLPDHTNDGGKDEDPQEVVDGDEDELPVGLWWRYVSYGGKYQGGPVQAVQVLPRHQRVGGGVAVGVERGRVHPAVLAQPHLSGDEEVEAGVPMDAHHDARHQGGDAEYVWVVGPALCASVKLGCSV